MIQTGSILDVIFEHRACRVPMTYINLNYGKILNDYVKKLFKNQGDDMPI
jgi:hypothetical protein